MGRIQVLPEVVANRIAAGEVVERPSSVVKELVENALDAGAAEVEIRVEGSGATLIEVSDDGCGMDADDALLAFDRHATSKIRDAADITHVSSFGFRGEALPSIASVAEVELITSTEGGEGTRVRLRGGEDRRREKASRARGTTIRVRNLFFHTPARRKFMKSDRAEEGHLRRAVMAHAIARPGVGFRYVLGGEEVFRLPAGEDLLLRVTRLFGRDFASELVPVEGREHGPHVTGLISKPDGARGNRSYQYFHVNGRPVQQTFLVQAATVPYRDILPPRRYPAFFVGVEIDPEFVDVNIHPTKREVRFSPERTVFSAIERAVRRALGSEGSIGAFWRERRGAGPSPATPGTKGPTLPFDKARETTWTYRSEPQGAIGAPGAAAGAGAAPPAAGESSWLHRVDLGEVQQVGGTFLVASGPDGVLVADQHTVHERILFEEALGRIGRREGNAQRLLFPETVEVDPALAEAADEFADVIESAGFLVRPIGPRALILEGTPPGVRRRDPGRLLVEFLEYLVGEGKAEKSRERKVAASIACHGAVRAGDVLTPDERKGLLLRLARCAEPLRCPHGRPTFLTIPADELARRFLRT